MRHKIYDMGVGIGKTTFCNLKYVSGKTYINQYGDLYQYDYLNALTNIGQYVWLYGSDIIHADYNNIYINGILINITPTTLLWADTKKMIIERENDCALIDHRMTIRELIDDSALMLLMVDNHVVKYSISDDLTYLDNEGVPGGLIATYYNTTVLSKYTISSNDSTTMHNRILLKYREEE